MEHINKIKIYADGADINSFNNLKNYDLIKGFTTNPTLMKQAGVLDYKKFALEVLKIIKNKEISFEVFADDVSEMEDQAREIASWGSNIAIKIPITNTLGQSTNKVIENLSRKISGKSAELFRIRRGNAPESRSLTFSYSGEKSFSYVLFGRMATGKY